MAWRRLVTLLGILASLITVLAFVTGRANLGDMIEYFSSVGKVPGVREAERAASSASGGREVREGKPPVLIIEVDGPVVPRGLSFDGIDDFVSVPHRADLNFGRGDFSLVCWVLLNRLPSNDVRILSKMGETRVKTGHQDGYGYALTITRQGTPRFNIIEAGVGVGASSPRPLTPGNWHMIAGVRRNGTLRLFIDGEMRGSHFNDNNGDNSSDLLIGAKTAPSDERWLDGRLDEVRLYNRALDTRDIRRLVAVGG